MGLFKSLKDMKEMVHEAPGMVDQAKQMQVQAQEMQAAQQAAAYQPSPTGAPAEGTASTEPIEGVSLEVYAQIAKQLGADATNDAKVALALSPRGITTDQWKKAAEGWNERMQQDRAVAKQFNTFYRGA